MDLTMPGMDGVETYQALRVLDPEVRVLLTSGYNEQESINHFVQGGLAGFVQKPFSASELARVVRRALTGVSVPIAGRPNPSVESCNKP
jgi:DNA-binding NarL/FixJ family response regulator